MIKKRQDFCYLLRYENERRLPKKKETVRYHLNIKSDKNGNCKTTVNRNKNNNSQPGACSFY